MKKIAVPLIILISMVFMLFVLAVIINLPIFDEELLPEVQAIKDIKAKSYEADNAYPALLAMTYYPDDSYQSAISKMRELLNKNITEKGEDFLSTDDIKLNKKHKMGSTQLTEYKHCHTRKERNCIQKSINQIEDQVISDHDALTLIERYEQLIDYDEYYEPTQLEFASPLLEYGPSLDAQRILLLQKWLYNQQDFLSFFYKDLHFWRTVLKDSHVLITKMVSVAAIHNDIQVISYVIQTSKLDIKQLLEIQNQVSSLTKKEKSLLNTFSFELKGAMNFFLDYYTNEGDDFIGKLFYQPQATTNLHYITNIKLLNKIDKLDSRSFYQAFQTKDWPDKPKLKSAISLYNPTGKLLITQTIAAYQDYIARMHDLDAMLELLNLRIEIALNNDQNIASVINNSDHKNPYTDKAFDYDSVNQTIGFDCLDRTSVCEIAL